MKKLVVIDDEYLTIEGIRVMLKGLVRIMRWQALLQMVRWHWN